MKLNNKYSRCKENPALPKDTVFALVSLSEGKAAGCTYAGRKYKTEGYILTDSTKKKQD